MTAQALHLPSFSTTEYVARQALGRRMCLAFTLGELEGELALQPAADIDARALTSLASQSGPLALTEAGAVLSLLGETPVAWPAAAGEHGDWFWDLVFQAMSPEVRQVFGALRPGDVAVTEGIACRFDVRLGEARVASQLLAPAETLLAMLQHGGWTREALELPDDLPLDAPVIMGRLQLSPAQLIDLRSGDVLLPEQPFFDVTGHGQIRLGRHWMEARVDSHAAPLRLTVLALEETAMDDTTMNDDFDRHPGSTWDDSLPRATADHSDEQPEVQAAGYDEEDDWPAEVDAGLAQAPDRFDDLPLPLTIRCGRLRMTLGELRNLAPGALLTVDGPEPGMASLFYGERAVAQGELVEIDGRLGLQITRVDVAG